MRRLVNAPVFTGDHSALWVDAVAVDGGVVVAAGSLDDVRAASPGAEEVDVAGCTVLPGLIDAHNHFLATGESLAAVDVRTLGATSRQHLVDAVADAAALTELGGLITGFGFDPSKYPDGAPDRRDLDAAAPKHRVLIYHVSGHGALVSTAVLEAAGVTPDMEDPEGGRFVRDAAGELTGLCFDSALHVLVPVEVDIGQHGPNFHVAATADELRAAVLRAQSAFVAAGLTTVCDAQVTSREMTAYQDVHRTGDLAVRTVCMPLSHQLDQLLDVGVSSGFGDDRLHLGPMKFYADGTLLGGTALLAESYGCDHTGNGHLFRPMADIRRDLLRAAAAGWRVGVHAQGDEAIAQLLPALEEAAAAHPRSDLRPRIEHAGLPPEGSLPRLAAIGAIAVSQPSYLYEMGDQFLSDLGERAHLLQPWRDELAAGVRLCLSSDSDVASYRPLHTIAAALDRTSAGGALLGPRHRLSLDEALFAHTAEAAYAIGREHDLGALTPGRRADVTVVEGDLRHVSPAEIRGLSVRATMIDGAWVHGVG